MECSDCELSVLLCGNGEIRRLNKSYRKKDKATDVLSFLQLRRGEKPSPGCLLGDVVISLPTAARQAREYQTSLQDELLRLLVHGVLHLLGYQHERVSAARAQRMRRLEKKLLGCLL